jgi:hypothetical protein
MEVIRFRHSKTEQMIEVKVAPLDSPAARDFLALPHMKKREVFKIKKILSHDQYIDQNLFFVRILLIHR